MIKEVLLLALASRVHIIMGARASNLINNIRRRRGTSRIGTQTTCPVCGRVFNNRSTYNQVNSHIDECLINTQIPSHGSGTLSLIDPEAVAGLSFDMKCEWFRARNDSERVHWQENSIVLMIDREQILEHSLGQILQLRPREMHTEFNLLFEGEIGKDAGGVLKEWVQLLNSKLMDPATGLYRFTSTESVAYSIQPLHSSNDLKLYRLHGLLLGKALFEGVPINCRLSKALFLQLVGKELTFEVLRFVDHAVYTTLKFMQTNDISNLVFETFSVQEQNEVTGQSQVFDLKRNGRTIDVTEANKHEYISLRSDWELSKSSLKAAKQLINGFHSVVDLKNLSVFEPEELELLLCGLAFIDVADWEAFTVYKGEFTAEHKVVRWFWEVLEMLSQEQLSKLLQFVMGTTRLPVEGFKTLKTMRGDPARFTLESAPYSKSNQFPRAHTCFNRLDLPLYPSKAELTKQLVYVIMNHSVGFGIE